MKRAKCSLYMPKTGDQVQATEQEWYQIGYGALYELTPAENGRSQRRWPMPARSTCEVRSTRTRREAF